MRQHIHFGKLASNNELHKPYQHFINFRIIVISYATAHTF